MKRLVLCVLGPLLVGTLAGCGDGKTVVNGTVTLDGEPVPKGAVTFVRSDGDLVREGAVIEKGAFQVRVPPGKYRIEVNGRKVVGKKTQKGMNGQDEEIELTEELFPEKYNLKSELTADIKSGDNPVKLELSSTK
jgi:hypothetical protein